MVGYKKHSRTLLALALSMLLGTQTCMPLIIPQSWDNAIDHACDKAWEFKGSTAILTGLATIIVIKGKKWLKTRNELAQKQQTIKESQNQDATLRTKYQVKTDSELHTRLTEIQKDLTLQQTNKTNTLAHKQAAVANVQLPAAGNKNAQHIESEISATATQQEKSGQELKIAQEQAAQLQQQIKQIEDAYQATLAAFTQKYPKQPVTADTLCAQLSQARDGIIAIAKPIRENIASNKNNEAVIHTITELIPQSLRLNNIAYVFSLRHEPDFLTHMQELYGNVRSNVFDILGLDINCAMWISPTLAAKVIQDKNIQGEVAHIIKDIFSHQVYTENYAAYSKKETPKEIASDKFKDLQGKIAHLEGYLTHTRKLLGQKPEESV